MCEWKKGALTFICGLLRHGVEMCDGSVRCIWRSMKVIDNTHTFTPHPTEVILTKQSCSVSQTLQSPASPFTLLRSSLFSARQPSVVLSVYPDILPGLAVSRHSATTLRVQKQC